MAGDAYIQFAIQYRASSGNPWTEIDSTVAAGYNDYDASQISYPRIDLNVNQAPGAYAMYKYQFTQIGEYRVVTAAQGGDGATAAKFTVKFGDGTYSSGSCTASNNPCSE